MKKIGARTPEERPKLEVVTMTADWQVFDVTLPSLTEMLV